MHKLYLKSRKLISDLILLINPGVFKKIKFKQQNSKPSKGLEKATIEPELFLVEKLFDKQSIVFDIGSNIGTYLYAFEKITPPANIYGFEPNQKLFLKLKKMFRKVNLSNIAFSDVSESADLKIPIINNKIYEARGTLNLNFREIDEDDFILVTIKKERLDNYVVQHKIQKIDFIKIDVEGHEFNILKGAVETLRKFKPTLLIEIEQRHHQFPISQIDDFLFDLGYLKYFFYKEENKILPGKAFNVSLHQNIEKFDTGNYINNFIFIDANKINNSNMDLERWQF